jgi:hypothetical protein
MAYNTFCALNWLAAEEMNFYSKQKSRIRRRVC